MALTLTIGGSDFLPVYKTGSIQVTSQLYNQGDTLSLELAVKSGQTLPQAGQEIILKDGSRFLFGGYITRLTPTEYGIGQLITYSLEANDYTYLLANKGSVQEKYESQTLGDIVNDLITNYVDAGYSLSTASVATGPTITSVTFNHISLRQCFEKLAKLTNYIWWIDYQKVIHFINPVTASAAPERITDTSKNIESIMITTDVSQVRNEVIIQGGTQESSNYTDIFIGDGQARGWVLTNTVITMVSIELDTGGGYASQTFGIDGKDNEALYYFMYSPSRGSFRMSSGSTTPAAGNKIRVIYTYPLPVLEIVQDLTSINLLKTIEGGDGIHSYTINDTTIISQNQARDRGLQELQEFAQPILQGEFFTRTGLLQAGTFWTPGTAITVNLPSWGINVDTVYLVQKVSITIDEGVEGLEYHFDVTFGGRLLGVTDFLIALATPESPLDENSDLQKIFAVTEAVTIAETITKNSNLRTVSETVSIAETITKRNYTPPFLYDDAVNSKWNEAEWA